MAGNEVVSRIYCWFEHLSKGVGMVKDARDIFKHCHCDLEELVILIVAV